VIAKGKLERRNLNTILLPEMKLSFLKSVYVAGEPRKAITEVFARNVVVSLEWTRLQLRWVSTNPLPKTS
jgi:hypothetical protein